MPRIYDLDVELLDGAPRVWRRVRVPAELTLADLHHVIQVVMHWDDYHLHVFEIADSEYGPRPDEEAEDDRWAGDDADITVALAFRQSSGGFDYVYDFGNDWRVRITAAADTLMPGPVSIECVAGDGAAPSDTEDMDPMPCDLQDINARLSAATAESLPASSAPLFADADDQLLADVTLLALFLGSWEERSGVRMAWKTVRFEILDVMNKAGLVATTPARKSLVLTDAGVRRAEALRQRVSDSLSAWRTSQ